MSSDKCNDHANKLLKKMRQLRSEFSDLVIVVDGEEFTVNKIVISAASQYFRSLIQYDISPSSDNSANPDASVKALKVELKLPTLKSDIFKLVVDYIYSGEITLNDDNIEDLLLAADVFIMEDLQAFCWSYLSNHINSSNCIGIYTLAQRLGSTEVSSLATKCIEKNFLEVYQGEEFLQLSADAVYQILMLENLNLGHDIESLTKVTETVVLKAILRWINHDKDARKTHLGKLLKTVRWGKIKADGEEYKRILEETEWKSLIEQTLTKSLQKKRLKMTRGQIEVMAVVGGGPSHKSVFCLPINPVTSDQMCMADLKRPRIGHSVVATGGYMYVIGAGDGEFTASSDCERYDPAVNAWKSIAPLEAGQAFCQLAAIDNKIYCLGGTGRYGFGQDNEVYDITTNKWSPFPYIKMMCLRTDYYFASLHNKLYYLSETGNPSDDVDFRADDEHCLENPFRLVQCYDPAIDEWSAKSPVYRETTSPPGKPEDCIFIINEDDEFVYDTTRNTWEELPEPNCNGVELSFQGMSGENRQVLRPSERINHVLRGSDSFYVLHESGILKTSDPRTGEWELITPEGLPRNFPKCSEGNVIIMSIPAESYVIGVSQPKPDSKPKPTEAGSKS